MSTQYTIADLMKEHRTRAITRMEQQSLKDIEQYILHAIATAESRLYDGITVYRWDDDSNDIIVDFWPHHSSLKSEFCDMFEMDIRIANKDKYIMFLGNALQNMGFDVFMYKANSKYDYDAFDIRLT